MQTYNAWKKGENRRRIIAPVMSFLRAVMSGSRRHGEAVAIIIVATLSLVGCQARHDQPSAPYVSLSVAEASYGPLITAGNHPTGNQNGTGERLGFFQDANGSIWGLPLTLTREGATLACAPPALHDAPPTDTYPEGSSIIGAANNPTGFREGTGGRHQGTRHPSDPGESSRRALSRG